MMDKQRVLVCSAWPYASGVPHLGNLVSSLMSGDVFARYYRLRGKDVLYVSGTDAHGTRIEFEAEHEGISPAELADRNHQRIVEVIEGFGIEFDNYTTTESSWHRDFIRDIYLQMDANGYICTKTENRAFCRQCEKFLADRFIVGTCPKCASSYALGNQCDACGAILEPEELIEPRCTLCEGSDIEFKETKHWYLDLPKLSESLGAYIGTKDFQGNVRRYTQQMIKDGLRPRAMTRDIDWGIPAPFEGAEGKVFYVWGEAALGYVSAVIEHFSGQERWKDFWFGEDVYQIYTQGKDNITFHTLIFPGQLIASQQGYHLPDQIAATEYLNWIGGESFSKSRGVGLYCDEALRVMDSELWRFYLLYNRPEGRDVNFSWEELEKAVNGILISNIANLINRVLSFVQTRFEAVVPEVVLDAEVVGALDDKITGYKAAMETGAIAQALRSVCDLAGFGNEYFQRKKPWDTKDPVTVASAVHFVKAMAIMLLPYVPKFATSVLKILGIQAATWADLKSELGGTKLSEDRVLLERIDIEQIQKAAMSGSISEDEPEETDVDRISFDDFKRLDLRIAEILTVDVIPGADKLYQLTVDFGGKHRTCVAGIKEHFSAEDLVGRRVVVLANLEPVTIRGVRSECMILAAKGKSLSLLEPNPRVEPGSPVS
ncbi:methionine--tRNA ligase [Candidatus Bipolaricaulota bacterium]|nr:methionine--tRNA ligase [Candidatus Bipolaricaulota bacterium]